MGTEEEHIEYRALQFEQRRKIMPLRAQHFASTVRWVERNNGRNFVSTQASGSETCRQSIDVFARCQPSSAVTFPLAQSLVIAQSFQTAMAFTIDDLVEQKTTFTVRKDVLEEQTLRFEWRRRMAGERLSNYISRNKRGAA